MKVAVRARLGAVVVGAAAAVTAAAALAANSISFTDAQGDSGQAPDVSAVVVSSDDGGTITVRISLANRTDVPRLIVADEQVGFGLDVDQNPDTGAVFYGSEFFVSFFISRTAVYRSASSGLRRRASSPFADRQLRGGSRHVLVPGSRFQYRSDGGL